MRQTHRDWTERHIRELVRQEMKGLSGGNGFNIFSLPNCEIYPYYDVKIDSTGISSFEDLLDTNGFRIDNFRIINIKVTNETHGRGSITFNFSKLLKYTGFHHYSYAPISAFDYDGQHVVGWTLNGSADSDFYPFDYPFEFTYENHTELYRNPEEPFNPVFSLYRPGTKICEYYLRRVRNESANTHSPIIEEHNYKLKTISFEVPLVTEEEIEEQNKDLPSWYERDFLIRFELPCETFGYSNLRPIVYENRKANFQIGIKGSIYLTLFVADTENTDSELGINYTSWDKFDWLASHFGLRERLYVEGSLKFYNQVG